MADTPDPQELARRYLDLWQQHLTQAATDPELAAAMAKFWQNLPAGMTPAGMTPAGMTPGVPGWPPIAADTGGSGDDDGKPAQAATSGPASGSAPAAASPDGGSDVLDELLKRMAALEERLDALDARPRGGGKRAAKGTGKRKS
tara:strand:+ start:6307 stop:6738 length:432 start_codon:yes stop_codon:yes gene_type:complete